MDMHGWALDSEEGQRGTAAIEVGDGEKAVSDADADADADVDDLWWVREEPSIRPKALAKIGRAVLRLRLYYGWSQAHLEHRSKVDQTTISRLERGKQGGLNIRRLAAVLDALNVGEIVFDQPALVTPPTNLELMLFGDRWERATREADRRLRWPHAEAAGSPRAAPESPAAAGSAPGYDIDA